MNKVKCPICQKEYSPKGIGTHIWRTHGEGQNHNPNSGYESGRVIWNKGHTLETHPSIEKGRQTLINRYESGELAASGFCSEAYIGSEKHRISSAKGGGFRENAGRGIKSRYKNINGEEVLLRSSFEVKVAEYLNFIGVLWIQPKYLNYTLNGKVFKYFPDFYVPSHDLYIETKNDYLMSLQIDKMESIKKEVNKILILTNSHMDQLEEIFNNIFNGEVAESGLLHRS